MVALISWIINFKFILSLIGIGIRIKFIHLLVVWNLRLKHPFLLTIWIIFRFKCIIISRSWIICIWLLVIHCYGWLEYFSFSFRNSERNLWIISLNIINNRFISCWTDCVLADSTIGFFMLMFSWIWWHSWLRLDNKAFILLFHIFIGWFLKLILCLNKFLSNVIMPWTRYINILD
jgi:hypothetical protein